MSTADGKIYEFTPSGAKTTFASGLSEPFGLLFNSAGNLFEADWYSGHIYQFTPQGVQSTFVAGLNHPGELAFQPVAEPSALPWLAIGAAAFFVRRQHGIRKSFT